MSSSLSILYQNKSSNNYKISDIWLFPFVTIIISFTLLYYLSDHHHHQTPFTDESEITEFYCCSWGGFPTIFTNNMIEPLSIIDWTPKFVIIVEFPPKMHISCPSSHVEDLEENLANFTCAVPPSHLASQRCWVSRVLRPHGFV